MFRARRPCDCVGCKREPLGSCVGRWSTQDRRVAPIWDAERQLLFVGDVRLYNRGALSRALDIGGTTGDVSDAEIAWRAYLRWGEDSPKHLVGDFAFAVWDERRRSVFAARDHFGIRPLYYSVDSRRAFVASDVRQLLAVTPQPAANIDAQAILERFSLGRANPRAHVLPKHLRVARGTHGHDRIGASAIPALLVAVIRARARVGHG